MTGGSAAQGEGRLTIEQVERAMSLNPLATQLTYREQAAIITERLNAALASQESTPGTQPPEFDSAQMAQVVASHLSLSKSDIALIQGYLHRAFVAGTEAVKASYPRIGADNINLAVAHPPSDGKLRELIALLRHCEQEMIQRANDAQGLAEQRLRGRGNGYRDAADWLEAALEKP